MKYALAVLSLSLALLGGCRPAGGPVPTSPGGQPPPAATKTLTVEEARQVVEAKEQELEQAKRELRESVVAARQAKCRWLVALLGMLALGSAAGAYFLPVMRLKLAGASALCVGAIPAVLFVSRLAPYWEWIGLGILLVAIMGILAYWHHEHRSFRQVVSAVEDVKTFSPETWRSIEDRFKKKVDMVSRPLISKIAKLKG